MTLDDIKRDIRHDDRCAVRAHGIVQETWERSGRCNCTRRDKIALLERLQEVTELLRQVWALPAEYGLSVGEILGGRDENDEICEAVENLLAAAEEAQ